MKLLSGHKRIIQIVLPILAILGLCSCTFFESRVSVERQSSMQFPRIDLGTAVVNGRIYAIGGYTDQTVPYVEEYNTDTDTWTRKADMPTPRRCFAIGVIDDLIYVTGGMDFTDPNNLTYVVSTEIYDPSSNIWTSGSDFPMATPVNSLFGNAIISGVAALNKLYVIVYNSEEPDGCATYMYDPGTDLWSTKTAPYGLGSWEDTFTWGEEFTTVMYNDRIYMFSCGDLAEYDPEADFWNRKPSAWGTRYHGAVNVLGDRIYAIYGIDSTGNQIPGVEVYYTDTNLWARQGWIKNPRAFFSSLSLDDSVYVLGGAYYANRDWSEPLDLVERIFMRD